MPKFHLLHMQLPQGMLENDPAYKAYMVAVRRFTADCPDIDFNDAVEGAVTWGLYHHIATLEAESLNEVLNRTKSKDAHWTKDPSCGVLEEGKRYRNTAFGDIVQNSEGTFYAYSAQGWEECLDRFGELAAMMSKDDPAPAL